MACKENLTLPFNKFETQIIRQISRDFFFFFSMFQNLRIKQLNVHGNYLMYSII